MYLDGVVPEGERGKMAPDGMESNGLISKAANF